MNPLTNLLLRCSCCIAVIIHLMPQCASAQGMPLLDSLRRSVQQAPNDTARISALCRLSDALCIVDGKDSLGRIQANVALHLAERLSGGKYEPFAAYYRTLTLQTLGVTYRFAGEGKRLLAEPYFRAALEEARRIPEEVRSLQMQASVQHAWFTGLRFRIHGHRKDDKPIIELYNQAERLLEAQQAIAEKLSSNALRGQIALNRAIVLTDTLAQRLLLCLESVRFYEQSPDIDGLERSLNYLGFYAEQIGDYPRAVQAYKRVVRLHDSVEIEPRGLAVAYQAMGDIYAKLSDTTKALENYHRAEPYSERYDVRFNRIELLFQIGTLYRAIGSPDKARTYFERAMVLSKERKEGYDLVRSAQLYRLQDNFRAALAVLAQSLREIGNLSPQTFSYDVLFEVALVHKEQAIAFKFTHQPTLYRASLDSALHYAKKCLPLLLDETLKIGSADRFLKIYTLLYELSKEAGDSKNALLYHEECERWSNKTLSSETHRAIAAMESRAVVEAAEAKIETLEANNRLQRTVGWAVSVGVIGLMVIIGLLTWRYRERKRSSALLQQQNEQLTALNNEKSEIMGIVSHDLKNPISAVAGFAEILREPMIDEQNKLLILDQLSLVSNRMLELVKNVLDVYKIEEGALSVNITTIDIVPVCKMMVEMYREQASTKDITLNYTAEKESIVLADEQMLNQIIDNLLSNAVKYTPRGKQAWIRVLEKSSFVRVEIENEGEGISEEDMKRLFGKFARLSAQPTGGEHSTGLGLSIVKKMVEAMNGKVWCESDVGKGATFIVELPQIL